MQSGEIKKEKARLRSKQWRKNNPEKIKLWRLKNREKIREFNKLYKQRNSDEVKKSFKKWYNKPENKKRVIDSKKTDKFKRYLNKYRTKRRLEDPGFKAISNLRSGLNKLFSRKPSMNKNLSTLKLIGCSREELKIHLEKQFRPGMNWENYNYNGWHIDHIIPLSTAKSFEEIVEKKLMHYTNLQPLWRLDNQKKGGVKT